MTDSCSFLAELTASLDYDALSPLDRDRCQMFIQDLYAAAIAGLRVNGRFNRAITDEFMNAGGRPESTVFGCETKLPAMNAAFLNGCFAHGADMDDGTKNAMGHVGASVIAAVLALAERERASGKAVITAIVAGYEVFVRLGGACQPGMIARGFHSTGIVGAVAAAAACAKLMALDADRIAQAMAIATTQSAGLMSVVESGQEIKPINPGKAAQTGVLAAALAAKDVRGPDRAFEIEKGFFWSFAEEVDWDYLTAPAGENHLICSCYQKPYPSCRHTHPGIDAAIALRDRITDLSAVEELTLLIYPTAIDVAGRITVPKNADEAKFSIAYAVAHALVTGGYGLSDLAVEKNDPSVASLAERIRLVPDAIYENRAEGIRGARLEIRLKDGSLLGETVSLPKGDDRKPFTEADMADKLARCAGGSLSIADQQALLRQIAAIDDHWDGSVPNLFLRKDDAFAADGQRGGCIACRE